jgi:hypothetical protein
MRYYKLFDSNGTHILLNRLTDANLTKVKENFKPLLPFSAHVDPVSERHHSVDVGCVADVDPVSERRHSVDVGCVADVSDIIILSPSLRQSDYPVFLQITLDSNGAVSTDLCK